jgi:hypothetical protein
MPKRFVSRCGDKLLVFLGRLRRGDDIPYWDSGAGDVGIAINDVGGFADAAP